jgi:thiol-disulfide isomerase/thioredoxin
VQKRLISYALLAASAASAAIIDEVRESIAQNNLALGESQIQAYRTRNGVTPEMIAALSWLGRGALAAKQYDKAGGYATQTYQLAVAELKKRPLDAEPHLPIALGAAIEVEAQSLAARGERDNAVTYLHGELKKYAGTSITTRIRKNINLLSLEGKPAPAIDMTHFVGPKPLPLESLRGKPVLLFFWAHWCGDCKTMIPHLARLEQEFAGRFQLVGVTRHYGYVAQGEEAPPAVETKYIDEVRQKYYARLGAMPVPVSDDAFSVYGSSTSPTLIFVDSKGIVRLYRPGKMTYDELRAALVRLLPS